MPVDQKKALFIVERNLYYKYYGPVIEALLEAGVEVHLLHSRDTLKLDLRNQKILLYPFLSQVPAFKTGTPVIASYASSSELKEYVESRKIRNIFSLHSRSSYREDFSGIRWHSLQHGIDSFYEKDFDADHFYVYTSAWINLNGFKPRHLGTVHEVSNYHIERGPRLDREEILKKYCLPGNKRYLLFAPLPSENPSEYGFIKGKIRRHYQIRKLLKLEIALLKELKLLAEKHNFEILIKSRFKRFLSPEYNELGHVFYDETFHPSTLNELIYLSDFTLCNFIPSAICTEALSMGKPYRVINYPELSKEVSEHVNEYITDLFLPGGKEDLLNFYDGSWKAKLFSDKQEGMSEKSKIYKDKFLKNSLPHMQAFTNNLL